MTQATWSRELAWAGGLLGLVMILGFIFHWPLVQASLKGNVAALLDQKRQVGLAAVLEDVLLLGAAGWLYWREWYLQEPQRAPVLPRQPEG